ncbi:carbohydrate kinase family protein [Halohasta litorea]|uniref:Carbohydrate kinase n=1 Tax=Halohasta litorea TaxID=869891 RepID=A0ABD6D2J6_9EURY|nr:carbohydrate kinase [Halohasta litorea]
MTESQPSVLVAGEMLVDFIPDSTGPLAGVETFDRRAGGAPANVAVGLARLEETPWLCTTLSTDPFGEFLANRLTSEGLPEEFVTRVDNSTALAFVSHGDDADREFSFYRERTADTVLQTDVVDTATLSAVDWLVVGGVTLSAEPSRSATFELVERAQTAGCRIVFDPNTRPELWAESDDMTLTLERMLRRTDVLKATHEDFEPTAIDAGGGGFAERLLQKGPEIVLLTEGTAGARAVAGSESAWGDGEWHHAGYEIDAVDTTGAGDAFLAGAIAALVEGREPSETLALANAVAALATTEGGAMTALPDRAAVDRLMEEQ